MTMTTTTTPTKIQGRHCENCGATDYESLETGDQGYTACCNECVCDGHGTSRFGTDRGFKRACCWAVADRMFAAEGREAPEGSSRLF